MGEKIKKINGIKSTKVLFFFFQILLLRWRYFGVYGWRVVAVLRIGSDGGSGGFSWMASPMWVAIDRLTD